jgi:hypothetical protein
MLTIDVRNAEGTVIGTMYADEKEFKTGSKGYWAGGKLVVDGKKYQASCTLVEIGSGPKKA